MTDPGPEFAKIAKIWRELGYETALAGEVSGTVPGEYLRAYKEGRRHGAFDRKKALEAAPKMVSATDIARLIDMYYDEDFTSFNEDGWRFVRDLRELAGLEDPNA